MPGFRGKNQRKDLRCLKVCRRSLDSSQFHKVLCFSFHEGVDYPPPPHTHFYWSFKLVVLIQVTLELPDLKYTYARPHRDQFSESGVEPEGVKVPQVMLISSLTKNQSPKEQSPREWTPRNP